MIFKIFLFFKIYATVLPKNHPKPFLLSKGIDFDSFSRQNNENSPKLKNCLKIRGLLLISNHCYMTENVYLKQGDM